MENEIIATALEQLAYAIREYPMQAAIVTKVLIANELQEITIQFSVGIQSRDIRPLEAEITIQQSKKAAAALSLTVLNTQIGELELRETVNLKHLDDAYPYFEKALDLFTLEETE
jgi:hypothetical protein